VDIKYFYRKVGFIIIRSFQSIKLVFLEIFYLDLVRGELSCTIL
jgi:hypothetical protein